MRCTEGRQVRARGSGHVSLCSRRWAHYHRAEPGVLAPGGRAHRGGALLRRPPHALGAMRAACAAKWAGARLVCSGARHTEPPVSLLVQEESIARRGGCHMLTRARWVCRSTAVVACTSTAVAACTRACNGSFLTCLFRQNFWQGSSAARCAQMCLPGQRAPGAPGGPCINGTAKEDARRKYIMHNNAHTCQYILWITYCLKSMRSNNQARKN